MSGVNFKHEHDFTLEKILSDLTTSRWLKVALEDAISRDPVDALNDAEILVGVLRNRWKQISNVAGWLGPQKVGGEYFCGYWQLRYTVTKIAEDFSTVTVLWEDGRVTTHKTPWDARRDKIVSQPIANGEVEDKQ